MLNDSDKNEVWFKGPTFLTLPKSGWPHFTIGDEFNFDISKDEKFKINSVYNEDRNACIQSTAVHPILINHDKKNNVNPVSDGYMKEELLMVFLHGKLCDSVDISKVIQGGYQHLISKIQPLSLFFILFPSLSAPQKLLSSLVGKIHIIFQPRNATYL